MGRTKIKKSKKEQNAALALARDRHNESRRKKYELDPEYRERVHRQNRDHYRQSNKVEMRKAVSEKEVIRLAVKRTVLLPSGKEQKLVCLTNDEMALALGGYHKFVLHRWHRTNRFPRGSHTALEEGSRKPVYLLEEAKRLVAIMREHQQEKLYLTGRDRVTIDKLFGITAQPK